MTDLFDEVENYLRKSGIDLADYHTYNSDEKVLEVASAFGEALYQINLEVFHSKVSEFEVGNQHFSDRMKSIWGPLLGLSEMFIRHSHECGRKFHSDIKDKISDLLTDPVLTCMLYLHDRSCQTSSEILCLAKNGFAAGVNARWRSLHENVVYAYFIKEKGPEIAQKYLDHKYVDQLKKLKVYQDYCSRLHHEPLSDDVILNLESKVGDLVKKYGKQFKSKLGWAYEACEKLTFEEIEKAVELDHLDPYYRFASLSIHADSGSCILDNLGYPWGEKIPSGATIWGVCDPCQNMAISMHQMNVAFLGYGPSILNLTLLKMFEFFVDDILETSKKCNDVSKQFYY